MVTDKAPALAGSPSALIRQRSAPSSGYRLRLMSYNIQTGIATSRYGHYVTRGWRHVLPHAGRFPNLEAIAGLASEFDIVGLQELDPGSFRSGFINQTGYLAEHADFPYWHSQTNRRIGRLVRHSNGILSRYRPIAIREHKLPGVIPGRGAIVLQLGGPAESLHVILVHLALGRGTRLRQLAYIAELINSLQHVIVMGDFNCHSRSKELTLLRARTNLSEPVHDLHTYPSWRPQRNIDHILVSRTLAVREAAVLDYALSDHLPVTMEVDLPPGIELVP